MAQMLPIYSVQFVLLLTCAIFWYRAADLEDAPRFVWSGLSVGIFLLTWRLFGWGWLGCLSGQVGLLAGITLVRVLRGSRNGP